jgi:mRNA interferase YafQ
MKFEVHYSAKYRRHRRKLIKRRYDMSKLDETIKLLAGGEPMPPKYCDHALKGDYSGCRECHIDGLGDWLLVYKKFEDKLILLLTETGTHSDLFE